MYEHIAALFVEVHKEILNLRYIKTNYVIKYNNSFNIYVTG